MNKIPLTVEFFNNHPNFRHDTYQENLLRKCEGWYENYVEYVSTDGLIVVSNTANLSDRAWRIHIDNEDRDSIASFEVETLEDANTILAVYGLKI